MSKKLLQLENINTVLEISKKLFEDIFVADLSQIDLVLKKLDNALKSIPSIKGSLERLEELEKAFKNLSKEDEKTKKFLSLEIEKNRALEIIKNCICGEFQLIDNANTDNCFNSPYRFRIYMDEDTYNEWYLKNKEEYDTLKAMLL